MDLRYDSQLVGASLGYVEFYVSDVLAVSAWMSDKFGFVATTAPVGDLKNAEARSIVVRQGRAVIVLTEGIADGHPATLYVARHGDGVANLALGVQDVRAAFSEALARGAVAVKAPVERGGPGGSLTAAVQGFGDLVHTFVQVGSRDSLSDSNRSDVVTDLDGSCEGLSCAAPKLRSIDHFAVCVRAGEMRSTVEFYESVLGFRSIFEERIEVGRQAMFSQVVQNSSKDLTLTIIEPDVRYETGQIDKFLENHAGPGVQHIAFAVDDVAGSVSALIDKGVGFLDAPASYYELLVSRIDLVAHSVEELERLGILVDEDHDGQLFQIFTRSIHERNTIFFEIIERVGAKTFGSGNIKALYEAVEMDRMKSAGREPDRSGRGDRGDRLFPARRHISWGNR